MIRCPRRGSLWLIALLAAAAGEAGARELIVDCADIGSEALGRALDAELADHPAGEGGELRVAVTCPGADVAEIVVETGATRRVRTIELHDVPRELRVRLVALAVAEAIALAVAATPPPAPAPVPEPAPAAEAAATSPSSVMPPATTPPPAPALAAAPAPTSPAPVASTSAVAPARPARFELVPSLGVRAYGPAFRLVPLFAAELDVRRWSFGASAFTRTASAPTGDVRLSMVAAGAGIRVGCADAGALRLCMSTRVDAGVAWADAAPLMVRVKAHDVAAPYLDLAARAVLAAPGPGTSARLLVDVGWAEGLIARAEDQEVARAAGWFVTLALGVQLW